MHADFFILFYFDAKSYAWCAPINDMLVRHFLLQILLFVAATKNGSSSIWPDMWSRLRIWIQLAFYWEKKSHFHSVHWIIPYSTQSKKESDTNFKQNIFFLVCLTYALYNKNKSITITDLFCSRCSNNLIFDCGCYLVSFFLLFGTVVVGYIPYDNVKYVWHW